jgi:hypothetical protein
MRYFIALTCLFFIIGLSVGSVVFFSEFQPSRTYAVNGEIVQAYFKISNTSVESGVGYRELLSYVFVVNITNLSDTTLRITQARINDINHIVSYRSDFTDSEDYLFYPNSSRLVAFSQVGGLYGLSLEAFEESHSLTVTMAVTLVPVEGKGSGGVLSDTSLPLKNISADEYVYGTLFNQNSDFTFGQLPLSAYLQKGQI